MKKNYMVPEVKTREIYSEDSLLTTASITGVQGADIEIGDDAQDGEVSDSRRNSIWDDEEF